MKKYYYCNFLNKEVKIYIGEFETDKECFLFFNENKDKIISEQEKLTPDDKLWFMYSF